MKKIAALLLLVASTAWAVPGPVIWGPGNAATVIPPVLNVKSINTSGGAATPTTSTWTSPTAVTGTCTNSASGTAVTGTGTKFKTEFHIGDTITMNAETRTISAIASDTALTTDAWTGANTGATATRAAVADVFIYPNGIVQSGGSRATLGSNGVTASNSFIAVADVPSAGTTSAGTAAFLAMTYSGAGSGGSTLSLVKARGSEASPAVPSSGDTVGTVNFRGWKAANTLVTGANMTAVTTETWSATAAGTQIQFKTTPNTTQTAAVALTLDQDQSTVFGGAMINSHLSTGTNADTVCLKSDGTFLIQAAACTISSRRFKENIFPLTNRDGLETIMALKPVEFNMIDDPKKPNADRANFARTQVGLIAEDVEKVDRRLAIYEPDGVTPKSYRQEAVIATLVKAVQEQQHEIEGLKRKLQRH